MYKRVNGERFVAAMIDAIIVSIIAAIPVVIYLFTYGLGDIIDYMVTGSGFIEEESWYLTFLIVTVVTDIVAGVIYFVYVPYKKNGQTLGKKIMSIKAIDEFGNNPSFKQHFIRAIQNWGMYISALTIGTIYISLTLFSVLSTALTSIVGIITFISYFMILIKEDGRGIHDLITDTRVVKADVDVNKEFVEKTTKMSDWAEVVGEEGKTEKSEDPWEL